MPRKKNLEAVRNSPRIALPLRYIKALDMVGKKQSLPNRAHWVKLALHAFLREVLAPEELRKCGLADELKES